jgi:hypothetical protein
VTQAGRRLPRSVSSAQVADRQRVADPVGGPDDEHAVTDPRGVRIGEGRCHRARRDGLHPQQSDISARGGREDPGQRTLSIPELDGDLGGRVDQMGGREDLAVGRDQDARTDAGHGWSLSLLRGHVHLQRADHDDRPMDLREQLGDRLRARCTRDHAPEDKHQDEASQVGPAAQHCPGWA